mmetsp:Transcript_42302/g.76314  ORF Transcript_42302/g.76314 Transcript_42302/m.76314 type:complete len:85 (+) Transcript_42302:76-330(+)
MLVYVVGRSSRFEGIAPRPFCLPFNKQSGVTATRQCIASLFPRDLKKAKTSIPLLSQHNYAEGRQNPLLQLHPAVLLQAPPPVN